MNTESIGCCGAFCGTCPELKRNQCKGCKIGYGSGERDIAKAKCKIKVCCIQKGLLSCANCPAYERCEALNGFFSKNGYKYKKYKESLDYIRASGYAQFLTASSAWTRQYGKFN